MAISKYLSKLLLLLMLSSSLAFYDNSDYVVELDSVTLEEVLKSGNDIWFVQFYDQKNKDCLNFVPTFIKIAQALDGFAKLGIFDVAKEPITAYQYGIKKVPTVMYRDVHGSVLVNENATTEGGLRELAIEVISDHIRDRLAERLVDHRIIKELSGRDIDLHVKNSNQRWLIAYYRSGDDTSKELAIVWKNVAERFHQRINFGVYDLDNHLSVEDKDSFPNIPAIFYFQGKRYSNKHVEYQGSLQVDEIENWAMERLRRPKIHILWDEQSVRNICLKHNYCILITLPMIKYCDEECRDKYKASLTELSEKYKENLWGWVIMHANNIDIVDKILDIDSRTKNATATVVNVKTLKYTKIDAPFEDDNLEDLLKNIAGGHDSTEKTLPLLENIPERYYKPWIRDEL